MFYLHYFVLGLDNLATLTYVHQQLPTVVPKFHWVFTYYSIVKSSIFDGHIAMYFASSSLVDKTFSDRPPLLIPGF